MRRWIATTVAAFAWLGAAPAVATTWERVEAPGRLVRVSPHAVGVLDPQGARPLRRLDGAMPAGASPIAARPGCTMEAFDERRALHDCTRATDRTWPRQLVVTRHDGRVLAEIDTAALRLGEVYPSAVGARLVELYDATYRVEDFAYVNWRTGRMVELPPQRPMREGRVRRLDLDRDTARVVRDPCRLADPPTAWLVRRRRDVLARICRSTRTVRLPGVAPGMVAPWRRSAFLVDWAPAVVSGDHALWITRTGRLAVRNLPGGRVRTRPLPPAVPRPPAAMEATATHVYVAEGPRGPIHAAPLPRGAR